MHSNKVVSLLMHRANEVKSQLIHDKEFLKLTVENYESSISQGEKELAELHEAIITLDPSLK